MKQATICLFVVLFLGNACLFAQKQGLQTFRIVSYNVENYFDCQDDSLTKDDEYLPGGMRGWSHSKFKTKQMNIAKVVTAIGGWNAPALVALCEIENRNCLLGLTQYDALRPLKYKFLHHESPDARGVDVALLYQPKQFEPLHDEAIPIHFPFHKGTTRDILYAKGLALGMDTLHIFVCHFPSRLGGELESEDRRVYVASVLRAKVDSILGQVSNANVIIMGDFNDYPNNNSMYKTLGAKELNDSTAQMYNMMHYFQQKNKGSHKFQGDWGCLDQIIVSKHLLDSTATIYTSQENTHIFEADWLLEDDKSNLGKQPFRTYIGFKYNGGFSDHLPVYIDLKVRK